MHKEIVTNARGNIENPKKKNLKKKKNNTKMIQHNPSLLGKNKYLL